MKFKIFAILTLAAVLAGCGDEPKPNVDDDNVIQVKEEADRTVLIGASDGYIYNMQGGAVYATLPGCTEVTSMTMHGENYYATGKTDDGQMAYWANGSAVGLGHNGYSLDIVRNHNDIIVMGANDAEALLMVNGEMAQSWNKYISGAVGIIRNNQHYGMVCNTDDGVAFIFNNNYTNSASSNARATGTDILSNAQGVTYYVSGYTHSIVNGVEVRSPCLWVNGQAKATSLDVNFTEKEQNNHTYSSGRAMDVAHNNQNIIAVGSRSNSTTQVATVWITSSTNEDNVRTYWQPDGNVEAEARSVLVYGSDVYVMTVEHNLDTNTWCTRIWMNHQLKGTVNGIVGRGFAVI